MLGIKELFVRFLLVSISDNIIRLLLVSLILSSLNLSLVCSLSCSLHLTLFFLGSSFTLLCHLGVDIIADFGSVRIPVGRDGGRVRTTLSDDSIKLLGHTYILLEIPIDILDTCLHNGGTLLRLLDSSVPLVKLLVLGNVSLCRHPLPCRHHCAETCVNSLLLSAIVIIRMAVNLSLHGFSRMLMASNLLVEIKLLALQHHHFVIESLCHGRIVEVINILLDSLVVGLHKPCLIGQIAMITRNKLLKSNHGTLLLVVAVGVRIDDIGKLNKTGLLLSYTLIRLLLHFHHVLVCCAHFLHCKQILISSLVMLSNSLNKSIDASAESQNNCQ